MGVVSELIEQSIALERAGEIGSALQRAQVALEQAQAIGDAELVATARNRVAFVHFRLGHYDEARALAQQVLTNTPADTPERVDALLMIGMCATETSDLSAEDAYLRAIDLSRQLGYHRALVRGLHNLAVGVYMPRGQFELSLAADQEALRLAQGHGIHDLVWSFLFTIVWVCWLTGRHEHAVGTLDELHRLVLPGSNAEGYYFCAAANLALDDGELDRALSIFCRARSIAEVTGEPSINILARLGLSRYYRAKGDACAARDWAEDALKLTTRIEYRHLQGIALIERALAIWQSSDCQTAEGELRAAIHIFTTLEANFDLARAWFFLAALLHEQKHPDADAAWLQAAAHITRGGYAFLLERERTLAFPLVAYYLNSNILHLRSAALTLLGHLERVPPPPRRVVTFVVFEVWQGTRRVDPRALHKRRARELLALLLLAPAHTLAFDQIADALWRDKPPAATQALFHQATSTLRRALEPELPDKFPSRYVQVEEGKVTLRLPAGSTIDFHTFEAHCRAEEWDAALALYGGDLFPDDRYAEWAIVPREHCKRLYLRALLITAHRQMRAGRAREALEVCHRILEIDPWQEDAVLLGMRACLAFNDRAGAVRLYRQLERTLREELNTVPQAELRALYQSLL